MAEGSYTLLIRLYKVAFSLVVLALSITSVVLVAETQTQRFFQGIPSRMLRSTASVASEKESEDKNPASPPEPHLPYNWADNDWRATGCTLNVHATGVCAYAITLGSIGIAFALVEILYASVGMHLKFRLPYIAELGLHVLGALWWYIGCIILSIYLQRAGRIAQMANPSKSIRSGILSTFDSAARGEAARMAIFGVAFATAVMYTYSLLINTALISLDVMNYSAEEDSSDEDESLAMETGSYSTTDSEPEPLLNWNYI